MTILTPTHNRAYLLDKCFTSLQKQTCKNFEWLIIDDGSTDNTEEIIMAIKSQTHEFAICYEKKMNGGKHTALNYSHAFIHGELTIILDDDDTLTENAVEVILSCWEKWRDDQTVWCMSFSRGMDTDTPLVKIIGDEIVSNAIDYRINARRDGDCAEVVRSEVFKQYLFPVFPGENFIGEDCMWTTMAYDYDTVYYSRVIYLCTYLEDGLTKSGRAMRLKNPVGGMYRNNMYLNKRFTLLIRIKSAILYDCYAIAEGHFWKNIANANQKALCLSMIPAGMFFYRRWSR